MSVQEYKSQLSDIEALLCDAPGDESLVKLKSDLLELIELTHADTDDGGAAVTAADANGGGNEDDAYADDANAGKESQSYNLSSENANGEAGVEESRTSSQSPYVETGPASASAIAVPATAAAAAGGKTTKKKKIKKKFEIPAHLLPLESDTDAERKKKKRTIKALKSKHKEQVKEVESAKKQNAWLDFSKKKRKNAESIFQTAEGGGKVGVVVAGSGAGASSSASMSIGSSTAGSSKRQRHTF